MIDQQYAAAEAEAEAAAPFHNSVSGIMIDFERRFCL